MKSKKSYTNNQKHYSSWSNIKYMCNEAAQENQMVLVLGYIEIFIFIGCKLLELYMTPTVLGLIERQVALAELLRGIILFGLGLLVTECLRAYVETNTLFGRIAVRITIINHLQEKFMITSYPNTENQEFLKLSDKAKQVTASNSQATEAIWQTLISVCKLSILTLIYIILLSQLPWLIVSITLITTLISYFWSRQINEWGYRHREEEAAYIQKMDYVFQTTKDSTYGKDIKIFGMKPWFEEIYKSANQMFIGFHRRAERKYFLADLIELCLTLVRNGIAYFLLVKMVVEGALSPSLFVLYFSAIGALTNQMQELLLAFNTLHKQSLDIEIVRRYLDWPEIFLFEEGKALAPVPDGAYKLEMKNVSFYYPGSREPILKNINLCIQPGEKIAIVGLNGAGKTTLIKLLCGFYDPTEGEVLLNGVDIKVYNRRDYYKLFSAVFQDYSLLAAPFYVNITQNDYLDEQKLKDTIKKTGLEKIINKLPLKEQTPIGKAVYEDSPEFSGGEIQKMMLARALYKQAPIIVLDEPTAALDPLAEAEIYKQYNELTKGKTALYISHRLASTRFCDRILLIEKGQITEEGTHENLLAKQGSYTQLFNIQSRYYQEEAVNYGA